MKTRDENQANSDKKIIWNPKKNLKFLLQLYFPLSPLSHGGIRKWLHLWTTPPLILISKLIKTTLGDNLTSHVWIQKRQTILHLIRQLVKTGICKTIYSHDETCLDKLAPGGKRAFNCVEMFSEKQARLLHSIKGLLQHAIYASIYCNA